MAEAITTDLDKQVIDFQAATVYVKASWDDAWGTAVDYLYAEQMTKSVAPTIGTATLQYEYGHLKRPDLDSFTTYAKQDISGNYVKIVVTPNDDGSDITWTGVVTSVADDIHGAKTLDAARVPQGNQSISCVAIEWLLTRKRIDTSVVATQSFAALPETIGRAIPFNAGTGRTFSQRERRANKTAGIGIDGVYMFSHAIGDSAGALTEEWTDLQIAEHLLFYQGPIDQFGNTNPVFKLNANNTDTQEDYKPTLQQEGRTVYDLLSTLFDRRRGRTWTAEVNASDEVEITIHSLDPDGFEITVPGGQGGSVPANTNQKTLDFDQARDVEAFTITDESVIYAQVVARGAPRTSIFTLSQEGETLVEDWTSTDESNYISGPGAGGDDRQETEHSHDNARMSETYRRVFSWFTAPSGWDFKAELAGGFTAIFPTIDVEDGSIDTTTNIPIWEAGMRFMTTFPRGLSPFRTAVEGTSDSVDTTDWQGAERRPFAVIAVDGTEVYQYVDRIAASHKPDSDERLGFACSVRMRDDALGCTCKVSGLQHLVAVDEFVSAGPSMEPLGKLDYKTLLWTLALEADDRAESKFPNRPTPTWNDRTEVLVIDVGQAARLDYICPGTVVGVEAGELVLHDGGFVRDDRLILEEIAASSYVFYQRQRKAFTMSYKQISSLFTLGDLITTVGSAETLETVNSLVSSITWDFTDGRTTIQTQFAELPLGVLL